MPFRGDKQNHRIIPQDRTTNPYAVDLVNQIACMNKGVYIDELIDAAKTNFCIGVAYYPEKHFESPNIRFGLDILKQKEQAGAHYGVSQMFFDNQKYFTYIEKARKAGIYHAINPRSENHYVQKTPHLVSRQSFT